jgi:hypothetical protein
MEIKCLITFSVISAWGGWRTGTFIKDGGISPLSRIFIILFSTVAGALLFWFATKNIGGLISSIATAVLVGLILLFSMGFLKKQNLMTDETPSWEAVRECHFIVTGEEAVS